MKTKKYLIKCVILLPMIYIPIAICGNLESKIETLISQMTLEEKIEMIHGNTVFTSPGVKRLNIPELWYSDGPHGVREDVRGDHMQAVGATDSSTYLPTGTALAATWNPDLAYDFGCVLGSEAKYRGKDVILGPGVNLIRTPLNGRNFEYMSEDPYLAARMVVPYIKGVQNQDVAACVKHYVANNQELDRKALSVSLSERALREIYMPAFKAAVQKAHVMTLMGAYNKVRGTFCCHHDYLLNKVLKEEWGFQGVVVSDWGGTHDTKEAALGGLDVEMGAARGGNYYMDEDLLELVKNGEVPEKVIDDKVKRLLRVIHKTKLKENRTPGEFNTYVHQQTTLKIAEEAVVLLKNKNNQLPLQMSQLNSIAVIGENAVKQQAHSGGSSTIKAKYEITPLSGLKRWVGQRIQLNYARGYKIEKEFEGDPQLVQEAVEAARNSDVAIVFGGLIHGYSNDWVDWAYDTEDFDRKDMKLPFGQDELIQAIIKANPNTIVVMIAGSPVDMRSWLDQVPALVQGWYAGMEGGVAIAKVLFGDVNPSGKLPFTLPKTLEDSPAHKIGDYVPKDLQITYHDDLLVGYRYFDTKKVEPEFCFGHGLSYTNFEYSHMNVKQDLENSNSVTVSVQIKNTGDVEGKEVVQLYVHDQKSKLYRPFKELKEFKKVCLKPGETCEVSFELSDSAFHYYHDKESKWMIEPGKFDILLGSSSKDIRLKKTIKI